MRFLFGRKRKVPRKSHIATIEFIVLPSGSSEDSGPAERGTVMDIGDEGLSFYSEIPLRKGQKLNIKKGYPVDICKPAVVKWVKKSGSDVYKAGVMFEKQEKSE
jgi:hypothetical protein